MLKNTCEIPSVVFRTFFILVTPLLFAQTFIYTPFYSNFCVSSPTSTFLGTDGSPSIDTLEQDVSNYLVQNGSVIQELTPILPINENWHKFDVLLENNLTVAIVVTEPQSYNEATTTFYIQTQYGSSTVPYGKIVTIAHGLTSSQFAQLITGWGFQLNHRPIVVGPQQWVSMQTNPKLGEICITTTLGQKYKILIYFECLFVFIGLAILLKEAMRLIIDGFYEYFIRGSN